MLISEYISLIKVEVVNGPRIFRLPCIELVKRLQLSRKWGNFVQSLPQVVTEVFLLEITLFISSPYQTASKLPVYFMERTIMMPY